MIDRNTFLAGIVEGFYGREWDWATRRAYAEFLREHKLNSYLYCPKSDPHLRKSWREPWPAASAEQLRLLAQHYAEQGLYWGVGLSPYALYQDYSAVERTRLRERIEAINDLGGSLLAILFDDMPGDCPDLAIRQADIVNDVANSSLASRILVCPTYYSLDPLLETHFGAMPQGYWPALGAQLPEQVDIFWTGNEVCSKTISLADIESIQSQLGRAPVLWDNYPVNDGARASRYLHLEPLPGRDPALVDSVAGHFCNPMNQAWLSQYPLSGLATLLGSGNHSWERYFSAGLAKRLQADQASFEQQGLDGMGQDRRRELADCYRAFDEPAAREVVDWLEEKYLFDPACLTG